MVKLYQDTVKTSNWTIHANLLQNIVAKTKIKDCSNRNGSKEKMYKTQQAKKNI